MKRSSVLSKLEHETPIFWVLILVSFVALLTYRLTTQYPVWVDEIFMKAVVFGGPFLLFAWKTRQKGNFWGLSASGFWPGAIYGLAFGGMFSFAAMFASALHSSHILIPNLLYSNDFWKTFGLAFATAWWESLFFYGLVLSFLRSTCKSEWRAALLTTGVFVVFHAPILLIRGGVLSSVLPLSLLALFALGQAIVFLRYRSLSTIVVSHAFWGMALLVYTLR